MIDLVHGPHKIEKTPSVEVYMRSIVLLVILFSGCGARARTSRRGFYVHPQHNKFLDVAREEGTDKVQPLTAGQHQGYLNVHDYDYL